MVSQLVERAPASGERGCRCRHRRDLLAGRELGGGVEALAHRRRLVLCGADQGLEQVPQRPSAVGVTIAAAGTTLATRSGRVRNSRSAARQLRQVRMWGRSVARDLLHRLVRT